MIQFHMASRSFCFSYFFKKCFKSFCFLLCKFAFDCNSKVLFCSFVHVFIHIVLINFCFFISRTKLISICKIRLSIASSMSNWRMAICFIIMRCLVRTKKFMRKSRWIFFLNSWIIYCLIFVFFFPIYYFVVFVFYKIVIVDRLMQLLVFLLLMMLELFSILLPLQTMLPHSIHLEMSVLCMFLNQKTFVVDN